MRPSSARGLVSPCINPEGKICPRRNYSHCMDSCPAMQEFKDVLHNEKLYLCSSQSDDVTGYNLSPQDGTA